jgi:hypothetical protein
VDRARDPIDVLNEALHDLGQALGDTLQRQGLAQGLGRADGSWDTARLLGYVKAELKKGNAHPEWRGGFDRGRRHLVPPAGREHAGDRAAREQEMALLAGAAASLAAEMQTWRNAEAHNVPLGHAEVLRALDSAERLLWAVNADEEADDFRERRDRFVLDFADHLRAQGWGSPVERSGPVEAGTVTFAATWADQSGGQGSLDDLWYAIVDSSGLQFDRATPGELVGIVEGLATPERAVLGGFAFSLGAPAMAVGPGRTWESPLQFWEAMSRLADEYPALGDRMANAPSPFWGLGLANGTPPEGDPYRATEKAVEADITTPHSILQLTGRGNVGSLSLAGLPIVDALRKAGFRIWPFHPTPAQHVLVEVFPRALLEYLRPPRSRAFDPRMAFLQSRHADQLRIGRSAGQTLADSLRAFDAVFSAWALSEYGNPLPDTSGNALAQMEGEIWIPR